VDGGAVVGHQRCILDLAADQTGDVGRPYRSAPTVR